MKLETLREEIDQIDASLMALFKQRMNVARHIGTLKRASGLPIADPYRESLLMRMRQETFADETLWPYFETWLKLLIDISKEVQR